MDPLNKQFSKFSVFLFFIFLSKWGQVFSQVSFTSIPVAVNGTINVCAGSTILFTNTTASNVILQAPVTYNWNFGGGQVRNTNGPHAITYSTQGTYTVTLVMSSGGAQIPNNGGTTGTITVNVGPAPTNLPSILPANTCTNDTIINSTLIFQTSNGNNSCSCQNISQGPAIGFTNTSNLGGATITIHWGGNGTSSNGGTGPTTITSSQLTSGPFNSAGTLINFPGQSQNPLNGHYSGTNASGPGSYNLIYVVNFPNGCVYSSYAIMSWGLESLILGLIHHYQLVSHLIMN